MERMDEQFSDELSNEQVQGINNFSDEQVRKIAHGMQKITFAINRIKNGVEIGDIAQETEKIKALLNDHGIIDTQSILNEINSPHDTEILESQRILTLEYKNLTRLAKQSKKKIENAYEVYRDFLLRSPTTAPKIENYLPLGDKRASSKINYLLITTILGGGAAFGYLLIKSIEIGRKKRTS